MAEASVKLFQHRLKSLLGQEPEILLGPKNQILLLITKLDEIGSFAEVADRTLVVGESDDRNWVRKLRTSIYEAEDCVDDFIIQVNGGCGSDQKELVDCFESELEKINSSISDILNTRPQFEDPLLLEEKIRQSIESQFPDVKGEESAFASYMNLPYDLKFCLSYCTMLSENSSMKRGRLVRILVAIGLVQESPGELMEDKAKEMIEKLVALGMLVGPFIHCGRNCGFFVPSPYREFSLHEMKAQDFFIVFANSDSNIPPTTRHVSCQDADNHIPNMSDLHLHSLLVFGSKGLSSASWDCLKSVLCKAKFLRVLDLERSQLESLPDEVGELVHLTYLSLKQSKITELPESISNLRSLQTLDVRWSGCEFVLPKGVLNLMQLRHLLMFQPLNDCEVRVPEGIERLKNLQTLKGIYAGGGIADELRSLTQLKSLEVRRVSDDHASELFASIMMMNGLLSLSLSAERVYPSYSFYGEDSLFPSLESFTPPPLLQKLHLKGSLTEIPIWLGSMVNLTNLSLMRSHLSENPTTVVQFLPNLTRLQMYDACKQRRIGRDFCEVGGFLKLEYLTIASRVLEEWTEIEEGALPSLKSLCFHNCLRLRFLPEGLQHVTTLQELHLSPLHADHARRLRDLENYKIKHIPLISAHENGQEALFCC